MNHQFATLLLGAILAAPAAVPIEPVTAIVDAFRTHGVVAVTAGHGAARGYAFGQLLIHDPRLIAAINDIVIEEGSARYQDIADRFVRGDNVPWSRSAPRGATRRSPRSSTTARGRSSFRPSEA